MRVFQDRRDAGRKLALHFEHLRGYQDVVVLALPRGGVPVAYEIATHIAAPLDVLVVRKVGVPGHSELAMGAIASGGIRVVDQRIVEQLGVSRQAFDAVEREERVELERREKAFREGREPVDVGGKTVIIVDDGLATGATMAAAVDALRTRKPAHIVVAVPVASPETCAALGQRADEIVCLLTPERMYAVGAWYRDFAQTTDEEVRTLLDDATREAGQREPALATTGR